MSIAEWIMAIAGVLVVIGGIATYLARMEGKVSALRSEIGADVKACKQLYEHNLPEVWDKLNDARERLCTLEGRKQGKASAEMKAKECPPTP